MAAALRYLSTTNAEGAQVRTAALWIRPASRQRCLVTLPGAVVDDLALTDHLVSVGTANGAGTIDVVPVLIAVSALQRVMPGDWVSLHDFPENQGSWPSLDALLDLEGGTP